MDFWQLEIFIKIVELKSFSRAATAIYITQPTVTSHIQSLESELDIKLLDRLTREVVPTTGGKVLYKYAKKLVALRNEARQNITNLKGKLTGSLIVGGSTIPGEYLLPTLMGGFRKKYSGITVSQLIGDSSAIAEKVLNGECEIGVIGSKVEDKGLTYREFVKDELIFIADPDFTIPAAANRRIKELLKFPFVIREKGSGSRMVMEKHLSGMGLDSGKLNIVAELGSTEAIKQAVKAGMGISIVSSVAVVEDLHYKTLKRVQFGEKKMTRCFYIITSCNRSKSPACEAFLDFLTTNTARET